MIQSNAKYNSAKASRRGRPSHLVESEMEEFDLPNSPDAD